MEGVLYIVATPIGNLSDLTLRAAEILAGVDFIAAEDTRVTRKLLHYLKIQKPMVSYYEHNLKERGQMILQRIEQGENCALCSDAGTPAISDPGEQLVKQAHEKGIRVVPVPGACAAAAALCAAGQPTGRWVFEGFLPTNRRQKKERMAVLRQEVRTVVFYEAPHKLNTTLQDLIEEFGADRSVTICRELTKLHEEIVVTTLGLALQKYQNEPPRGEFVLVMQGAQPRCDEQQMTLHEASEWAKQLMQQGMRASEAAKAASACSTFSKSEIYRYCMNRKESD